ncbi:hypothetical protein TNCV_281421 [Trichonephila clavipes]|nr:hypothetical protein TNCV_281421 [Trichonephila clavipes]
MQTYSKYRFSQDENLPSVRLDFEVGLVREEHIYSTCLVLIRDVPVSNFCGKHEGPFQRNTNHWTESIQTLIVESVSSSLIRTSSSTSSPLKLQLQLSGFHRGVSSDR